VTLAALLLVACLLGLGVPRASGQEGVPPQAARAAYDAVRLWVNEGRTPDGAVAADGLADLGSGFSGVSVTLRAAGVIAGRGRLLHEGGPPGATLARAAQLAIDEARQRGHYEPGPLSDLAAAGERLIISLELAAPLVPIPPRDLPSAATLLRPGHDGVALRIGTRHAFRFPSQLRRTRTMPADALPSLVAELTGDPSQALLDPATAARRHEGRFFRFTVVHLAQPTPGAEPLFMHRGGRLVRANQVTTGAIREFAQGLAEHLAGRLWPGPEGYGLMGTYDPALDGYEPVIASDLDQAAAALALARYARRAPALGLPEDSAIEARTAALDILRRFTTREGLGRLEDPLLAGLAAAALIESGATLGEDRADMLVHDRALLMAATVLRDAYRPATGFRSTVLSEGRAVVAFGLVAVAEHTGQLGDLARAEGAMSAVFRETTPGTLVNEMPWLGWAAIRAGTLRDGADRAIPQGDGLRQLRDFVWLHQLAPRDASGDDADLLGGIVFTAAAAPLPSWHSTRPLALIATMLGNPYLTAPEERMPELSRLMSATRFLLQLAASDAEGHAYADPPRARWGVRASAWDHRMPVQASALTLLTLVETLDSMARLQDAPRQSP